MRSDILAAGGFVSLVANGEGLEYLSDEAPRHPEHEAIELLDTVGHFQILNDSVDEPFAQRIQQELNARGATQGRCSGRINPSRACAFQSDASRLARCSRDRVARQGSGNRSGYRNRSFADPELVVETTVD